ncbi:hypothetical protein [Streptomyces sp. NPDC048196]|uniref:hypothetical protein n=1 Tax=Streptomyces sp. NPDC048196 TaxID=3154712 RepID=UPI0033CC1706
MNVDRKADGNEDENEEESADGSADGKAVIKADLNVGGKANRQVTHERRGLRWTA